MAWSMCSVEMWIFIRPPPPAVRRSTCPANRPSLTFHGGGAYSNPINFTEQQATAAPRILMARYAEHAHDNVERADQFGTNGVTCARCGVLASRVLSRLSGGPLTLDASVTISGISNTFAGLTIAPGDTLDLRAVQLTGPLEVGLNSMLFIDNLSGNGTRNLRIGNSVPLSWTAAGWISKRRRGRAFRKAWAR